MLEYIRKEIEKRVNTRLVAVYFDEINRLHFVICNTINGNSNRWETSYELDTLDYMSTHDLIKEVSTIYNTYAKNVRESLEQIKEQNK